MHDEQKLDDDAALVRAALALKEFEIRLGGVPLTNSGLAPGIVLRRSEPSCGRE